MKLNFQKLDIEIPVEIPVNFMILTGTGIPAKRLILTGTGILPGSRSILGEHYSVTSQRWVADFLASHYPSLSEVYISLHWLAKCPHHIQEVVNSPCQRKDGLSELCTQISARTCSKEAVICIVMSEATVQ